MNIKNLACSTLGVVALAGHAAKAASITFVNQDSVDRTVVFTQNAGLPSVPTLQVPGGQTQKQSIPDGWIGNAYAVPAGQPNVPGILAEVAFQSWGGTTYFDVSTEVNQQADVNGGIKTLAAASGEPESGCQDYSATCANAYNQPNDIQTKGTSESDLVATLGTAPNLGKRKAVNATGTHGNYPHFFVNGTSGKVFIPVFEPESAAQKSLKPHLAALAGVALFFGVAL